MIKHNKNYYLMMLFCVCIIFAISFYMYITKLDIYLHDVIIVWGEAYNAQAIWGLLSRLGQDWFQIIVSIFFGILYYKKCNYRMSRLWYGSIVVFLISGIFVQIVKFIIGRPRPKLLPEYDPIWFEMAARFHSWPSGHTITTFAWLACLLPFYSKKIQLLVIATACLIAFSRVGIGAHYISDVLSGAVLGYSLGALLRNKFKLGTKE